MGLLKSIFYNNNSSNESKNIIVKNRAFEINNLKNVHPDILNLLWFKDGSMTNYKEYNLVKIIKIDNISLSLSHGNEEPSLIYTTLPIETIDNISLIDRPPYYPVYCQLSNEQRGVYWNLLNNPYNTDIDIGYVFLLYYGLERHLLGANYEQAFEVVLKIRNLRKNKSFQYYSGNALLLTALNKQRPDLALMFIKSLDEDHEYNFSHNLFLLCKLSLQIPVLPNEIVLLAKSFNFKNNLYIKNYPDLFLSTIKNIITKRYSSQELFLHKIVTENEIKNTFLDKLNMFANTSIMDNAMDIPNVLEAYNKNGVFFKILNETHEDLKAQLSELRKTGEAPEKEKTVTKKEVLTFDKYMEQQLLDTYNNPENSVVNNHFNLLILQDFYYKYRNIDEKYLLETIKYCKIDIDSLDFLQDAYKEESLERILNMRDYYSKEELKQEIMRNTVFLGNIPAFKRLAIIYEKQKEYHLAVEYCEKAIDYYTKYNMPLETLDFKNRKENYLEKLKKSD